jgi:hypothetical protein
MMVRDDEWAVVGGMGGGQASHRGAASPRFRLRKADGWQTQIEIGSCIELHQAGLPAVWSYRHARSATVTVTRGVEAAMLSLTV